MILFLASAGVTQAQSNDVPRLAEVEVIATRLSLSPFQQPYALYRHDRDEMDAGVGVTALDRIDYGPGVIIQHTAPGQTSPYIRGLTGKQSLLLLDGVRLSHATMRSGPNEYAAFVPDMSMEKIDVLLGSSGVVNGSDGLTGALDFRLAPPGRGLTKPVSPWVTTRLDSANGVQTAAGVDGQAGDWRYSAEGSYDYYHDRIGGKNADDRVFGPKKAYTGIPNTAFDAWAAAGRAAYDGFLDRSLEVAFGRSQKDDARRPDGYYENSGVTSRISRYYDPEIFTYLHLRDRWMPGGLFFDQLITTAWWHQFDEYQTREELDGGRYRRREYDDRVDSLGVEPQFTSHLGAHEITYGALALFEQTRNRYRDYRSPNANPAGATPLNPTTWPTKTTVTDGAEYNTYAVYAQDLWRLTDQWSLLGGLRYTYVNWNFDVAHNDADDFTGSLRASWQFRPDMLAFVGVSKAFRAPNLVDLNGATDRASSGLITFGNPNLRPEVGYTVEAGWRYARDRDQLAATVFYTFLDDIIQTVYSVGSTNTANGAGAYLRGFELQWDYGLPLPAGAGQRLALFGSLSYVDSNQEVSQPGGGIVNQPISRANRFYGLTGLRYELNRNWWIKAQLRFHDDYGLGDITPDDATDVRLTVAGNPNGSVPGYVVVDIAGGWTSDDRRRWASLTVENVANTTYRQLGSGADAPGLNLALAAGVRF
jgi:outer membrane receptor protein involved in Fe transport